MVQHRDVPDRGQVGAQRVHVALGPRGSRAARFQLIVPPTPRSRRDSNHKPLMLIGTGGTTGTGTIDDLIKLNAIAKKFDLWFHVDAAYGGASIFSQQLKAHLKGIEFSDSITFDAHKWMSLPM